MISTRWKERQIVEIFHLLLLANLGSRLDRKVYAIKGGCNLRFFFGSPRFSEDLDIDLRTVDPVTLRNKVERLLPSKPLELQLAAKGITIHAWSAPKQTDTTQRWKVQLGTLDQTVLGHTKLEFSRRGLPDGREYGPVDPVLIHEYGLQTISSAHYGREAAFWQKVRALADRTTIQARDVFDLDLLLRLGPIPTLPPATLRSKVSKAVAHALGVTFDDFTGQVLAYLPDEEQSQYDSDLWQAAVLRVVNALGALT